MVAVLQGRLVGRHADIVREVWVAPCLEQDIDQGCRGVIGSRMKRCVPVYIRQVGIRPGSQQSLLLAPGRPEPAGLLND